LGGVDEKERLIVWKERENREAGFVGKDELAGKKA
jgi:hypothetical protein